MNRYAIIENGVVANIAVGTVPLTESWIEITDPAIQIGWTYENETFTAPTVTGKNKIVIKSLVINNGLLSPPKSRVIIQKGQSIMATVEFRSFSNALIPITDLFAVPVYQLGGIVAQSVSANFLSGVAQVSVTFPESGEFVVTEEGLNLHLPEEQKLSFQPFYISVLQT